jgi:uncharacterized protein (DUF924 family)
MSDLADEILGFWFGETLRSTAPDVVAERSALWFFATDDFDRAIRDRFGALPDRALVGEFDVWCDRPESALALTLILDQFPRNLFRDSPRAFAFDAKARGIAAAALAAGFDEALPLLQSWFLSLPFEHSEDPADQARSVALVESLLERAPAELESTLRRSLDFARRHLVVIERFGRFPHRNAVLGRESTPEEVAYLEAGGETFSGKLPDADT